MLKFTTAQLEKDMNCLERLHDDAKPNHQQNSWKRKEWRCYNGPGKVKACCRVYISLKVQFFLFVFSTNAGNLNDLLKKIKIIHLVDDNELLPSALMDYYWDKLSKQSPAELDDWETEL